MGGQPFAPRCRGSGRRLHRWRRVWRPWGGDGWSLEPGSDVLAAGAGSFRTRLRDFARHAARLHASGAGVHAALHRAHAAGWARHDWLRGQHGNKHRPHALPAAQHRAGQCSHGHHHDRHRRPPIQHGQTTGVHRLQRRTHAAAARRPHLALEPHGSQRRVHPATTACSPTRLPPHDRTAPHTRRPRRREPGTPGLSDRASAPCRTSKRASTPCSEAP